MVDHARARRLGERIKVLAAEAMEKVVKDPDLGFVTITDVRVSPDLSQAKLYFTVFGSAEDLEISKDILVLHLIVEVESKIDLKGLMKFFNHKNLLWKILMRQYKKLLKKD